MLRWVGAWAVLSVGLFLAVLAMPHRRPPTMVKLGEAGRIETVVLYEPLSFDEWVGELDVAGVVAAICTVTAAILIATCFFAAKISGRIRVRWLDVPEGFRRLGTVLSASVTVGASAVLLWWFFVEEEAEEWLPFLDYLGRTSGAAAQSLLVTIVFVLCVPLIFCSCFAGLRFGYNVTAWVVEGFRRER